MQILLKVCGQSLRAEYPPLYHGSIGALEVCLQSGDINDIDGLEIKTLRFTAGNKKRYFSDVKNGVAQVPREVIVPGGFDIALAGVDYTDGGKIEKFLPTNSVHIKVYRNGYGDIDEETVSETAPPNYFEEIRTEYNGKIDAIEKQLSAKAETQSDSGTIIRTQTRIGSAGTISDIAATANNAYGAAMTANGDIISLRESIGGLTKCGYLSQVDLRSIHDAGVYFVGFGCTGLPDDMPDYICGATLIVCSSDANSCNQYLIVNDYIDSAGNSTMKTRIYANMLYLDSYDLPWQVVADSGSLENRANKGQPNGYAPLDANGKIPQCYLYGSGTN